MSIPLLSEVESAEIADAADRIRHRKRVWWAVLVIMVFVVLKAGLDIVLEVMMLKDHIQEMGVATQKFTVTRVFTNQQ